MPLTLIYFLLTTLPPREPITDVCEVIEKNHYLLCVNADGSPHWQTQWVFWQIGLDGREQVMAWQLAKPGDVVTRGTGGWQLHCGNLRGGFRRRIEAISYRETWTQHDVELANREKHPVEKRHGLSTFPQSLPHGSLVPH